MAYEYKTILRSDWVFFLAGIIEAKQLDYSEAHKNLIQAISLSHAMRPGLQIRHFWVAKSLFLTITFHQKKQVKTFCF